VKEKEHCVQPDWQHWPGADWQLSKTRHVKRT
jgi:hypothetical protein